MPEPIACDICATSAVGRVRPLRPELPDSVVLCSDCLEGYLVGEVHLPAAATS
jgi:hypothetical protein